MPCSRTFLVEIKSKYVFIPFTELLSKSNTKAKHWNLILTNHDWTRMSVSFVYDHRHHSSSICKDCTRQIRDSWTGTKFKDSVYLEERFANCKSIAELRYTDLRAEHLCRLKFCLRSNYVFRNTHQVLKIVYLPGIRRITRVLRNAKRSFLFEIHEPIRLSTMSKCLAYRISVNACIC